MVLGLFPVDPRSGESKYYIFAKGLYKVGRKGCDIVIATDKGVSRIHAEILVDAMTNSSSLSGQVRIRDCSKYGTTINNDDGLVEKVHQLPNKETNLTDGSRISFGTGNATYKFSFVPLVFWVCSTKPYRENHPLQEKVSSIGAQVIYSFNQECTHVLVDEFMPVREDLLVAIAAKKPCVHSSWVMSVAEEQICTEIPSCDLHTPTITVDGVSVKLAEPRTREGCLEGYTFVLNSINNYKFGNQLKPLLELTGAKVLSVEGYTSRNNQSDTQANESVLCVTPEGSTAKLGCFNKLSSVSRINETDLICAVLTGKLDRSVLISPCVIVSSSCSTDETIVADSEAEDDNATSVVVRVAKTLSSVEVMDSVDEMDVTDDHDAKVVVLSSVEVTGTENKIEQTGDRTVTDRVESFRPSGGGIPVKRERVANAESENVDIIYSQCLIVRDINQSAVTCTVNNDGPNFKRFRKKNFQSGNSFENFIPYSQYPYKESANGNEEMAESLEEEKRRKQIEAIAEDLFNNEKGRRRPGVSGGVHGLLTKSR